MDNFRPEETKFNCVTSRSGETLGKNFHVSCSKCIRKFQQRYDLGFGSAREWNNDAVASIVYII